MSALGLIAFAVALGGGALAVGWPYLSGPARRWPAEPPGARDEVARAVSSLRDLRFAEAAGTIDPADATRLRALLERSPFAADPLAATGAPLRTVAVAALVAAITAVLLAQSLPQAAGDRAPGAPITGTVGQGAPTIAELEARLSAAPRDRPTLLALADAYRAAGRTTDAITAYRMALGIDPNDVPALDGLAIILFQAGQPDAAAIAVDRVLALRPKDPDGLFLKGLILYQRQDWSGAVAVWSVYLDVGEFHPAAPMVRPLFEDARVKAGR